MEIRGRRINCSFCYCCYCSYCCCCYYCYYCFYSPIMGRAPDITTPLISFPLMGRALDIIFFTFSFPSVRRDTDPEGSRGWGILISSPKFVWGVWRDSPFNSRLIPFKRVASPAYLEAIFLIIYGVIPVIWVKVPRRGTALPRVKLRNIIRPSLVFRVFWNFLARQAPWRPPPGIMEFIKIRFLYKFLRVLPFLLFAEVLAILVERMV